MMFTQISSLSHVRKDQCWIHHACKSNLPKNFLSENNSPYTASRMDQKKVSLQQTFLHLYWQLVFFLALYWQLVEMPQISKHCFRTWKEQKGHLVVRDTPKIKAKGSEMVCWAQYQLRITVFLPGTSNLLSVSSSRTCTCNTEIMLDIQWVPSE